DSKVSSSNPASPSSPPDSPKSPSQAIAASVPKTASNAKSEPASSTAEPETLLKAQLIYEWMVHGTICGFKLSARQDPIPIVDDTDTLYMYQLKGLASRNKELEVIETDPTAPSLDTKY